jgi:hypothetical protein
LLKQGHEPSGAWAAVDALAGVPTITSVDFARHLRQEPLGGGEAA